MYTPYPGKLLSDELGFRVLKCYIYKFIKNRVEKRPRFDIGITGFTSKKYFWFNTLRPLFGDYHFSGDTERLENLKSEQFIVNEKYIYFMPQYTQAKLKGKRKSYVYCCSGKEMANYLSLMGLGDLQNITFFSSRFTWAVDLYEDTLPQAEDDMDILIYIKRPLSVGCL